MNNKEFLNQRACDMTVKELLKAAALKIKIKSGAKEVLTFAEEIKKYPKRFERLNQDCKWETINDYDGLSLSGTTKVLNTDWNCDNLDNKVFYVKYTTDLGCYKELVRRKISEE